MWYNISTKRKGDKKMEVLTVIKLYKILKKAIESGEENKIVLIPNFSDDLDADYRTISHMENGDCTNQCIYLEINDDEEEKEFWNKKRDKKMDLTNLSALSNAELETLIKEAHNCLNKRAEAKQTEAWEKLKEALKEYLKYDTIVIHTEYPEDTEICVADFQELSLNEEGVICVCD